jgi:hypothetical protein
LNVTRHWAYGGCSESKTQSALTSSHQSAVKLLQGCHQQDD